MTMIKLVAVEPPQGYELRLSFSDETNGVYDFAPFIDARTEMTVPLAGIKLICSTETEKREQIDDVHAFQQARNHLAPLGEADHAAAR